MFNLIEGLKIFQAHGSTDISAEHDVIYAGSFEPEIPYTKEELEFLEGNFGWHRCEDYECYGFFT